MSGDDNELANLRKENHALRDRLVLHRAVIAAARAEVAQFFWMIAYAEASGMVPPDVPTTVAALRDSLAELDARA